MPGRLRIRVPSKRGDTTFFSSLPDRFANVPGIDGVMTNPVTGSILFSFTRPADADTVIKKAQSKRIFKIRENGTHTLRAQVSGGMTELNSRIKGLTGGEIDLWTLSFLGLLGIGVYQIARGNFAAPAWYTAFWYAFNVFLKPKPE